ncbi:MAG TPA: YbhB/YbcL family Raf kinase inhibitor-like protein [Kofleriaceae bacterium]
MHLTSTAFPDGGEIPNKYAKDGKDVSPPLIWSGVPEAARSLALIVDDPDAPNGTWTHWVVVDLPPTTAGIPEGAAKLPGGRVGLNDWKHAEWNGPAPPKGRHRYVFTLYALDRELGLARPTKHQAEAAMAGHVLAAARLTGTYEAARAA